MNYLLEEKFKVKWTTKDGYYFVEGVYLGKQFVETDNKAEILIPFLGDRGSISY